jgi:hypothetical protein
MDCKLNVETVPNMWQLFPLDEPSAPFHESSDAVAVPDESAIYASGTVTEPETQEGQLQESLPPKSTSNHLDLDSSIKSAAVPPRPETDTGDDLPAPGSTQPPYDGAKPQEPPPGNRETLKKHEIKPAGASASSSTMRGLVHTYDQPTVPAPAHQIHQGVKVSMRLEHELSPSRLIVIVQFPSVNQSPVANALVEMRMWLEYPSSGTSSKLTETLQAITNMEGECRFHVDTDCLGKEYNVCEEITAVRHPQIPDESAYMLDVHLVQKGS